MVEQYSDCDFETLLAKYDYNFKRGDIVKGIVGRNVFLVE